MVSGLTLVLAPGVDAVIHYVGETDWRVTFRKYRKCAPSSVLFSLGRSEIESLLLSVSSKTETGTAPASGEKRRSPDDNVIEMSDFVPRSVYLRRDLSARLDIGKVPAAIELNGPSASLEIHLDDLLAVTKTVEFIAQEPELVERLQALQDSSTDWVSANDGASLDSYFWRPSTAFGS